MRNEVYVLTGRYGVYAVCRKLIWAVSDDDVSVQNR